MVRSGSLGSHGRSTDPVRQPTDRPTPPGALMGAVAKVFGVLLILSGVLLLVGGIAAAAFSATDEQDNQGQLLQDGERSDQNADVLVYGLAGAGLGLVLLIVGIVLVSIGPKPTASWVTAPAAQASPPAATPTPRRRAIVTTTAVAGAVALLALVAFAVGGGTPGGSSSMFGSFADGSGEELGSDVFEGTVAQGASLPVAGTVSGGDNDHDLQAPQGTRRLSAVVQWAPQDGGAETLEVIVTLADGTEVARASGAPGFAIDLADAGLDGAQLHYQVFPADPVGAVAEQPFTIETRFLAA